MRASKDAGIRYEGKVGRCALISLVLSLISHLSSFHITPLRNASTPLAELIKSTGLPSISTVARPVTCSP